MDNEKAINKKVSISKDRYYQNGIPKPLALEFKQKIIKVMEEEEQFLNPEFRLEDLSNSISLPRHQTSFVLNNEIEMDFNSYINLLRVEKAKELLLSGSYDTIAEVMYVVGFNSTSTFNRAFKKNTDLTPREFIIYHHEVNPIIHQS